MTSERALGFSFRRQGCNPCWWLGLLMCLFKLPAALANGDSTVEGDVDARTPQDRPTLEHLTLVAASGPGGGSDLTAQAMKQVLEGEGIVRSVAIERVPGDGGFAGLASFVGSRRGDGQSLLIGGMFMVGAAVVKHAVAPLNDAIPIAQITSDADVVVVPALSPYHTLDDLLEAMRRNPQAMSWAGRSVGGSDHPAMWQLARAAGIAPELMHYQHFHGAHEVAIQLASGRFSAAIDGYSELDLFIRSGQLRGLAIVSRQPLDGVSIPTFRQLGILGVSIANWCGAFAPPAVSDSDRSRLGSAIQQMVQSTRWRTTLKLYHLRSAYLDAADFSQLVREEQTRISKSEAATSATPNLRLLADFWEHRLQLALALASGISVLLIAMRWQKITAQRREDNLGRALQQLSQEVERRTREALQRTQDMAAVRVGMNAQIEREFERWKLTCAERSVAHLMLKGLRLKDIARARNTSDRTVRQQAQAIYRKAGLDGRTDLAAYFLESVLGAPELDPKATVSSGIAVKAAASRQHRFRGPAVREPRVMPLTAADSG